MPSFTVGALAVAARRANAVGAVRLTCAPEGLEVELVRVAPFARGFAPGSIVEASAFRVPYTGVRGLVRQGRMLYLALDPAVAAPHNRFALARFTVDPAEALARAYRARSRARWASCLLPGPVGALVALGAPEAVVSGVVGRGSLGLLAGFVLWFLLRELVAWLTWGGPLSDRYRDAFEIELSRGLGLIPPARPSIASIASIAQPLSSPPDAPEPAASLLRPVAAVAGAALGVVAVMAFLEHEPAPEEPALRPAELTARLAPVARELADLGALPPPAGLPRCTCLRADSPLWAEGVPRLGVLLFARADDGLGEVAPVIEPGGSSRYDFDVIVVNDSALPLRDVRLTFTFARRNRKGRRVGATDRGLFWGGELAPGRSVKWHVKAPGSELRLDTSVPETLEQAGVEPAPAEAFHELAITSRYRAVRLHAARMLAYLGDPRALEVLGALGPGPVAERPLVARLARAAAPVVACQLATEGDVLSACVFNGSPRAAGGLLVREAEGAGGEPPRAWPVGAEVGVHEGVRVSWPLLGGSSPDEVGVAGVPPP